MIYGIGIDIVSLDKIRSVCDRSRGRLKGDLFSKEELDEVGLADTDAICSQTQVQWLALKYAAKEAAVKAIGSPFGTPFKWSDIVVRGREKISVEINGNMQELINRAGKLCFRGGVSISGSHAMAIVIGESE